MDDGKCLLDVISDPQALKEFFRSTSQLAFVEGKVPPLTDKPDNKEEATKSISRNDNFAFSTTNSQSSNNQPSQSISTSSAHINKQSTPLANLSNLSNAGNSLGNFLGNNASSINNGPQNNTSSSNLTASNSRSINLASNNHNLVTSGIQSVNNLGSTKPLTIGIPSSQPANVPLSFGLSDASKARNISSTSSVSLLTVAKPIVMSPKQGASQQSTARLVPSPQAGLNATVRPQNLKSSPLPILRPKSIAPRPQNTIIPGVQNASQITIQGNVLNQSPKTTPMKGQPQLVAIRPKIVIAQSNTGGAGLEGQTVTGNSPARPKQAIQNTFTLGGKGQPPLPKQILNTLTVPHLKQGIQNQAVSKSGLANLVQLQPKQIAPKPEQVSTAQIGTAKLTQDLQVQTALLQNLLAQGQFGVQTNSGQKDLKQGTNLGQDNSQQQKLFAQQNQLKKLIQQNQLVRQAQQQQQQLTQSQQAHTQQQQHTQSHLQQHTQQQQQHTQQQQQHTQQKQQHTQQQQNMALLQMKSTPSNTNNTQQVKLQVPSSQTVTNAANLASQLKEAIDTKQLQQFLEKNPIVAQQLKQLNMRQAALNIRQQGVGNTVAATSAAPVKTVTQTTTVGQLQKGTVNQLQTVAQLQKSTINLNQKPSLTVGQFQKPTVISQLAKPTTNVNQLQKSMSNVTHLQKGATTNITQTAKPAVTNITNSKILSIPSTNQVTQITIPSTGTNIQASNQKPVTTQKVVIVQNANSVPTLTTGQPKVLLQTKEGRPILLSQEQFRQIQAQLASKNLSIQGKLVTAAPVTTTAATTTKPQVVVKSEATTPKVNQKVLPATAKTPTTKQEVTKSTKRPIKAVETTESKLIKRMKLTVQKDQNDVCFTDIHKPFKSHQDAITRLTPYHVFSEPVPNARMQHKANTLLDKLALQLTHKSDKMINKYRQLLLNDMQRDVPSAEVVMVNRIFLADEKTALLKEKQTMLEEAKQMAKEARATLSQMKTNPNTTANISDTTKTNQLSAYQTNTDCITILPDVSETIEISDDDSSPITSANSFLTHISNSRTDNNVVNRALEPG